MVYRITGEYTDENLNEIIDNLKQKYRILFRDGNLYVALSSYRNEIEKWREINESDGYENVKEVEKRLKQEIKDILKDVDPVNGDNFWIKSLVSIESVKKEDEFVQDWVRNNNIRIKKERFEIEKQEELIRAWNGLDELERELDKRLKGRIREMGNNNGNVVDENEVNGNED